ncbi:hypothetical protein [Luteimonas aquatica]|uniref:hypothetical protein n=1 Tax=Luteimonas aquatica TaxID=450364 RepID=UPI001F59FC62|nr:hypothetical protein [Luteimonas aquatica]
MRHPPPRPAILAACAACLFGFTAGAQSPVAAATADAARADHARDFDFLRGHWYVRNRRLPKQLQGSTAWKISTGTLIGMPLLEGMGNYDELRSDETGAMGVSVRFYDRQSAQWNDYWVAQRDGLLQPPVRGRFVDGVGRFDGEDRLDGKPILVRQLWTGAGTATPRWEQAFSGDGGRTWETNWVMDFSRAPMRAPADGADAASGSR